MEATMNIEQARKVMDATLASDPKDRPRFGDWQVAGQVIAKHYREHPEQTKPVYFTDAAKPRREETARDYVAKLSREYRASQRTKDQPPRYVPFEKSREWLSESTRGVRLDESWAVIQGPETPNPGMITGADLVQSLEGDASSYFIAIDPKTQKPALYRYRQPQQDPGMVGTSKGTMSRTMDRGPGYYRTLARQANTQRELAGVQLRAMNAANRAGWESRRG
jgi:hypothetical protein